MCVCYMFPLSAVFVWIYLSIYIVCVHVCINRKCVQPLRLNHPLFMCSPTSVSNHSFYQHSLLTLMCMCVCMLVSMVWTLVRVQPHTHICLILCVHVNSLHVPLYFCMCVCASLCVLAFHVFVKKENTSLWKYSSIHFCLFLCMHILKFMSVHVCRIVVCVCKADLELVRAHVCELLLYMWRSI